MTIWCLIHLIFFFQVKNNQFCLKIILMLVQMLMLQTKILILLIKIWILTTTMLFLETMVMKDNLDCFIIQKGFLNCIRLVRVVERLLILKTWWLNRIIVLVLFNKTKATTLITIMHRLLKISSLLKIKETYTKWMVFMGITTMVRLRLEKIPNF